MAYPITLLQLSEQLISHGFNSGSELGFDLDFGLGFNLENSGLETPLQGITTDTRTLKSGEVFVALRGERFDGHEFVERAIAQGAICAIVDHEFIRNRAQQWANLPLLPVENTQVAYQYLGRWWRQQFAIPVIGVTGSVGKTTTKELIASVLSTQGNVHKTQANYNNEIGVPKTLLQLTPDHDYAVIEMAMRGPGEIAKLTQITHPTIGLITNVGTAHIERLGSEAAIARAKCELLAEMSPTSIAVLNADNSQLMATAPQFWSGDTLTYGLEQGDLRGKLIDPQTLEVEGINLPLPLPGDHNALNFLAALAAFKVIQGRGISPEVLYAPLKSGIVVNLPGGRAQKHLLADDIILLDETYNAGLESMTAALKLLRATPGQRHIAVLGTMKELGAYSVKFHQQVGQIARELNLDALFIFADPEAATAMATGAAGLPWIEIAGIESEQAHQNLADRLQQLIQPGDRILFKASRSVALNRVVERLQQIFSSEPD
ncbi:MAG: UDP-N-acetylmuramoyl-tripeptide--D-alanyl-D-alanine ligase [Oscillatoriales cyanobacterium RM2_1_1]|nr:UDP-N-acetylmuramoyl-tripeptide--D-alanyl-D-alanine ligase [Oscillatoriales cyanobacterium SM2_3_0]NJO46297.1 UDP-N-acetylmuramoyl-tripeptide--D-alanyl-D-alanine ligase [Oscillatoriales cyanobacterium RM2_1_1]